MANRVRVPAATSSYQQLHVCMGMRAAAPLTEVQRVSRLSLKFLIFLFVCRPLAFYYHEH
jgi:hypothetical protein